MMDSPISDAHGGDVVIRHNHLRDIVADFCRQAHLSVRVEAGYGLSSDHSNTRPADVLVQGWDRGSPAALDITVTSPLTPATLRDASSTAGAAAYAAECRKHTANDAKCQELGWACIPLAVETFGNWGMEAQGVFSRLASALGMHQGTSKSWALHTIYSRLKMSLICVVVATITTLTTTRDETSFVAKQSAVGAHQTWPNGWVDWGNGRISTRRSSPGRRSMDHASYFFGWAPEADTVTGHLLQAVALYHVALYDDVFVPVLKTYFPTLGQGRVQGAGQHLESQMQPGSTENEAEAKQLGEEGTVVIAEGTKGHRALAILICGAVGRGYLCEMTRAQQLVTFAAILLVPHLLVGWSWIDVHPLVCFAVIAY
eukprot:Em0002g24a